MKTKTTIRMNEDRRTAILWAIQKAVEELEYYVNNGNPEMDYAAEWPDVAKDNIARLESLAVICDELGDCGEAHDVRLAIESVRASLPEDDDAKA